MTTTPADAPNLTEVRTIAVRSVMGAVLPAAYDPSDAAEAEEPLDVIPVLVLRTTIGDLLIELTDTDAASAEVRLDQLAADITTQVQHAITAAQRIRRGGPTLHA